MAPARPALALHLSRRARERYRIEDSLFTYTGRAVFADVAAARRLADSLTRELGAADPGLAAAVTPGRLYAMGLVHELLHAAVERFRREVEPAVLHLALDWLAARLGEERLTATLAAFAREFPPPPLWKGEVSLAEYLAGESAGRSHREMLLEEMLLLWLGHASPAFAPFRELFDDGPLRRDTAYPEVMAGLEEFLAGQPAFPEGADGEGREAARPSLWEALRAPALASPESLSGQLAALESLVQPEAPREAARLARGADLMREEERPVFPPGPGPTEVPEIAAADLEGPERFSPDTDWMPSLVLVAKNALVWLWQLSRQHGRPIRRLEEIPDAELEVLARRGFTGLWLIGVWERSPASRRIKQLCGNPEAAASAYSVAAYEVAAELGGEEALADLGRRAARFGIRLACDMVPNHFGIDSPWVLEHPERFVRLPFSPFPSYRFTGPDLSPDPAVEILLEDHYYDRTDAAVVFLRRDRRSGEVAYVYHGNDGTGTPWNDTAQLDYLLSEVREAVLETILSVARRFPVIRFDAAMTLARRHVQRLWYPPPGSGGDIPSRAEQGLSPEEFDRAMPEEFWREVVDRVAEEAPGTLLLAEAFWLMEPYFVRTLGMHRVYNSAFMNLLREERNAEHRKLLKGMLAREPEILRRYVNFLNNPDERTAIDQFGSGDRYFGACTLLATLPGLPMFGHGQVEGLAERYGMEYARAYLDERPDPWVVARHERQVTPLLRRRRLFAGSERFRLYDFEKPGGRVDEDVFAYSNRDGDEVALVVYHNRPGPTRGRIRRSVPLAVRGEDGRPRRPRRESLAEALGLAGGAGAGTANRGPGRARGLEAGADSPPAGASAEGQPVGASVAAGLAGGEPAAAEPAPAAPSEGAAGGQDAEARGAGRLLLRCSDAASGLEHLFDAEGIGRHGLELALGPYQCHVFLDFAAVEDAADGRWSALCSALGGRGVPSLEEALLEPELAPVLAPLRELIAPELVHRFATVARGPGAAPRSSPEEVAEPGPAGEAAAEARAAEEAAAEARRAFLLEIESRLEAFLAALDQHLRATSGAPPALAAARLPSRVMADLGLAVEALQALFSEAAGQASRPSAAAPTDLAGRLGGDPGAWGLLHAWLLLRRLGEAAIPAAQRPDPLREPGGAGAGKGEGGAGGAEAAEAAGSSGQAGQGELAGPPVEAAESSDNVEAARRQARAWLDDLLLGKQVAATLRGLGLGDEEARDGVMILKVLIAGKLPPLAESSRSSADEAAAADEPAAPAEKGGGPLGVPWAPGELPDLGGLPPPSALGGEPPPPDEASPGDREAGRRLAAWLADPDVRLALRVNRFADTTWLHEESLERLAFWAVLAATLEHGAASQAAMAAHRAACHLLEVAREAGFQVERLLARAAPAGAEAPEPAVLELAETLRR